MNNKKVLKEMKDKKDNIRKTQMMKIVKYLTRIDMDA